MQGVTFPSIDLHYQSGNGTGVKTCRVLLINAKFDRITGRVWFEMLGYVNSAEYTGFFIEAKINLAALTQAIRDREKDIVEPNPWEMRTDWLSPERLRWVKGEQHFGPLGEVRDKLQPPSESSSLPALNEVKIPIIRWILAHVHREGDDAFLASMHLEAQKWAQDTHGAPSYC